MHKNIDETLRAQYSETPSAFVSTIPLYLVYACEPPLPNSRPVLYLRGIKFPPASFSRAALSVAPAPYMSASPSRSDHGLLCRGYIRYIMNVRSMREERAFYAWRRCETMGGRAVHLLHFHLWQVSPHLTVHDPFPPTHTGLLMWLPGR